MATNSEWGYTVRTLSAPGGAVSNVDLERTALLAASADPNEAWYSNADLRQVVNGRQTRYAADPANGLSATDVEMAALRAASADPLKATLSLSDLRRASWGG